MDHHCDMDHSKGGVYGHFKVMSWTAVIVAALVGIGLSFLLNLFSVAIGLTAFTLGPDGAPVLAIGGYIGLLIGVIASMFVMGMVAGFLGRPHCHSACLGSLYGFTAWCLALVLSIFLASSIASFAAYSAEAMSNPTLIFVRSTNPSAPAVTQTRTAPATAQATVDTQKTADVMSKTAFALFALFFVGAIASAFGGYLGQMCCRRDDEVR